MVDVGHCSRTVAIDVCLSLNFAVVFFSTFFRSAMHRPIVRRWKKARRTEQDHLSYNAPILMAHGCPLRHYCCISANSAKHNQKLMTPRIRSASPICAGNIVSKSPSSFSYLRLRHLHLHLPHNLRLPHHLFLPRHLHLRLPRPLFLLFLPNLKRGSAPNSSFRLAYWHRNHLLTGLY